MRIQVVEFNATPLMWLSNNIQNYTKKLTWPCPKHKVKKSQGYYGNVLLWWYTDYIFFTFSSTLGLKCVKTKSYHLYSHIFRPEFTKYNSIWFVSFLTTVAWYTMLDVRHLPDSRHEDLFLQLHCFGFVLHVDASVEVSLFTTDLLWPEIILRMLGMQL
jgi:hypothetical protein